MVGTVFGVIEPGNVDTTAPVGVRREFDGDAVREQAI